MLENSRQAGQWRSCVPPPIGCKGVRSDGALQLNVLDTVYVFPNMWKRPSHCYRLWRLWIVPNVSIGYSSLAFRHTGEARKSRLTRMQTVGLRLSAHLTG